MKRIILVCSSIVLVLIMSLSIGLAGCSSSSTDNSTSLSTPSASLATDTALAISTSPLPDDTTAIVWDQAINYIGKKVAATGFIYDKVLDTGVTLLGMGKGVNEPGGLDIEINEADLSKFPTDLYVGKVIQVIGTVIADAANEVSIRITDPSQVSIQP